VTSTTISSRAVGQSTSLLLRHGPTRVRKGSFPPIPTFPRQEGKGYLPPPVSPLRGEGSGGGEGRLGGSVRRGVRFGCEGLPQRSAGLGHCLLALIEHSRHAEETVNHAIVPAAGGRYPRGLEALGIGFPFIT
jgi:hypothetical protein